MEWISIKDRLPPINDKLLVFSERIGILMGINKDHIFAKDGIFFHYPGKLKFEKDKIENVSHWMPLPEPPKEPSK